MDQVCHCIDFMVGFSALGKELVGFGSCTIHLRCLYHEENSMDLVEKLQERNGS
jgi:hypothetical protein